MLEVRRVSKSLGSFSLRDVSFSVEKGDYFILLGESGAGKSVVLETIAGLMVPDSGTIHYNGRDITREKIQNRRIGLVFQDHAAFPHLTVAENLSYALYGALISKSEKDERVKAIAGELGIGELLARKPGSLSGGELQRMVLGRTLIQKPGILLLDEPLSSLDTRLRSDLRTLLRSLHRNGQTILHVTHDYEEALTLGTRVAVIHQGSIIQSGTPSEVFQRPASEFVAHFVGVKNYFPAKLETSNNTSYAFTDNNFAVRIVTDIPSGEGFVLIRGEDILLSDTPVETSATNNFQGTVLEIINNAYGTDVIIDAGIELHALVTPDSVEKLGLRAGKTCWVHFKATAVKFIKR